MRDKKIFLLVYIPLMTTVIVANSDLHTDSKSVIFAISALCMLLAGCWAPKPHLQRKKEKA